jgi:hypothetical protein
VKSIVTLPALAVSEVVSYFSSPSGFACRLSVDAAAVPPPEDELWEEEEEEVLGVVAGAAGADEELDVELPFEEPQPASASAARATLSRSERPLILGVAGPSVGVALIIACSSLSQFRRRSRRQIISQL